MTAELGTILVLVVQIVAAFARIAPGFNNAIIPKIVWVANFVILAAGYAKVVVEGLTPAAQQLGILDWFDPVMHDGYSLAGWGGFGGVLRVLGSAAIASILTAFQKLIYEYGTKPAIPQGLLDAGA